MAVTINHCVHTLTCAEHFRILALAQPTNRESLRDTEACLSAQLAKLYHMGILSSGEALHAGRCQNERRDWRTFVEFA